MTNSKTEMELTIKEKRLHPNKYYYIKVSNKNAHITSHPNHNLSNRIVYYTIDEKHFDLLNIIDILKNDLDLFETNFKKYVWSTFSNNTEQTDTLLQTLIANIKTLHPFFTKTPIESLFFLQNSLQNYFYRTYEFFIRKIVYEKRTSSISELSIDIIIDKLQKIHQRFHKPIINYAKSENVEASIYSETYLWKTFFKATNITKTQLDAYINTSTVPTDNFSNLPKNLLLDSLFCFREVLNDYVFDFSDIMLHSSKLSKAQIYCMFLTHSRFDVFQNMLSEHKIITSPNDIYSLLVPPFYRHEESGGIAIDDETTLFDRDTKFAYEALCTLCSKTNSSTYNYELKETLNSLNSFLPRNLDEIFNWEIHEFYKFEQLLYMEILEMVKDKYFVRTCSNSKCKAYFSSNNRLHKYCSKCASTRHAADQTYRESLTPIEIRKNQLYHQYYYQINKLDATTRKIAKNNLKEWNKSVSVLLDKYISENRSNDVDSFINELPPLQFK